MDITRKYLLLCPGLFGKHPGSETIVTEYGSDGQKYTTEKNEQQGSAGTVKLPQPCRNILAINCVDFSLVNASLAIVLPEIAPYGCWDYLPFTDPQNFVILGASTSSNFPLKMGPSELPREFDKNWFPVLSPMQNTTTGQNRNPIAVATRKKDQPPFHLHQLTAMNYVLQNNSQDAYLFNQTGNTQSATDSRSTGKQTRFTWFDVSLRKPATGSTHEPVNGPSPSLQNMFIALEVVMLDESPHIARNPTARGEVEAYENEFEVHNRQRRTASEINSALRARLKHGE
jgi:hypothetical protein